MIKSRLIELGYLSQLLSLCHEVCRGHCWNFTCLLNISDVVWRLAGFCLTRLPRGLPALVVTHRHFWRRRSLRVSLPTLPLNWPKIRYRWLLLGNIWSSLLLVLLYNVRKAPAKPNFGLRLPLVENPWCVPSINLLVPKGLPVPFGRLARSHELVLIFHWPLGRFNVKMGRLLRKSGQLFFLGSIKLENLHVVFFLSGSDIRGMPDLPFRIMLWGGWFGRGSGWLPVEEVWPRMH